MSATSVTSTYNVSYHGDYVTNNFESSLSWYWLYTVWHASQSVNETHFYSAV